MARDDDITAWLGKLSNGDDEAARAIWHRYFEKLVRLADKHLGRMVRRSTSEEDVALSAMNSFFEGARENQFPELHDRDNLWRILVAITRRKVRDRRKWENAEKRGGGQVRGNSMFEAGSDSKPGGMDNLLARNAPDAMATELPLVCEEMINGLDEEDLKTVARLKLQGYKNQEIADHINRAVATVERRLQRIRNKWLEAAD